MFSGEMSTPEAEKIGKWRVEEPEYQQAFLELATVVSDVGALQDDPEIAEAIGELTDKPLGNNHFSKTRHQWPAWAAAAGILLAAFIGVNNWLGGSLPAETDANLSRYVTRIGEQKTIELADGSVVTLNTGSEILVDMNNAHRRVKLARGEAYFAIAKDAKRPFSVDLGYWTITVLGTEFNLLKAPDKQTLAVLEGVVAIHREEESVSNNTPLLEAPKNLTKRLKMPRQHRVKAGTVVEFHLEENELLAYTPLRIAGLQDWRDGVLLFDDVPLSSVIKELNRYSGKKILIEDADIMRLKLYATLRVDRLDQALQVLEGTLPLKVVHHFDRIVIVGSK